MPTPISHAAVGFAIATWTQPRMPTRRVGIVAAVSQFVASHGGWIIESSHHSDVEVGRFFMRDQTVSWNPRKQHPDIVKPAGPIDPDVGVLYFESLREKPIATYVNFAMHPDTVGGEEISADYPGVLSRLLADYKGGEMLTVFANGCCGNLNHRNINWADPQKGPQEARRIGTVLAGTVASSPAGRSIAAVLVNAYALTRLIVCLGRMVVSPGIPALRLVPTLPSSGG